MRVYVNAEIDESEFSTGDLLRELKRRGNLPKDIGYEMTLRCADAAIKTLEEGGCPPEYLEPIKDWARQPILDGLALKHWYEVCGKPFPVLMSKEG